MDYEKLYRTAYMQVYSYAMTLCHDAHLAEEITQETFFKAMKTNERTSYREDAKVVTWLCAIVKNLFLDEMRRQKRYAELPPDIADSDDFESKVADEDLSFRIHTVLHTLEEPYKEVFSLRVFGDLPFEKIGRLFGKTETWARVTYHRARLKIQERMGFHET